MPPMRSLEVQRRARASAIGQLRSARVRLAIAERQRARATGTSLEPSATQRASECSAAVANRAQWLHWITYGETMRPEADGVWAHRRWFGVGQARPAEPRFAPGRRVERSARS